MNVEAKLYRALCEFCEDRGFALNDLGAVTIPVYGAPTRRIDVDVLTLLARED